MYSIRYLRSQVDALQNKDQARPHHPQTPQPRPGVLR